MKRGIIDAFRHLSDEYLPWYLAEIFGRWNSKERDGVGAVDLIQFRFRKAAYVDAVHQVNLRRPKTLKGRGNINMPIDIMSPLAASSAKRGGHEMAKQQGNTAVRAAGSSGQFSLGDCLTQDAQVKFVCIPAPNASPPSGPSIGYTVVRIDRN